MCYTYTPLDRSGFARGWPLTKKKDWYSISVETLRLWTAFSVVLALGVLGFFGYQHWLELRLAREATRLIDDTRVVLQQIANEPVLSEFRNEVVEARGSLQQAIDELAKKRYVEARDSARRSHNLLLPILDALHNRGASAEAHFLNIYGKVEFRRGERGDWQSARERVTLNSGDYVMTSGNGSAEIMFSDGTLYTVRPNTLLLIRQIRRAVGSSGGQTVQMEYGWVDLSTSRHGTKVATPLAEARVGEASEATVAYNSEAESGQYSVNRGSMEVASATGLTRQVQAQELVVQSGNLLSEPTPLLPSPEIAEPADNARIRFEQDQQLVLSWQPVTGASRYALQVSRNHLFSENIIDDETRSKASATLGIRGEGTFLWRVRAINPRGIGGLWSTPRTFRIAGLQPAGDQDDGTGPAIEILDIKQHGTFLIVTGKTEPGARVEINGEAARVDIDGSFAMTIQARSQAASPVEIRAWDTWGNETVFRPPSLEQP